jgi:hypothetical protein
LWDRSASYLEVHVVAETNQVGGTSLTSNTIVSKLVEDCPNTISTHSSDKSGVGLQVEIKRVRVGHDLVDYQTSRLIQNNHNRMSNWECS